MEMEAAVELDVIIENTMGSSSTTVDPLAQAENYSSPGFDTDPASSAKKRKVEVNNQSPQENKMPPNVSNCYVFKSRLQEYAQKAGLVTPVYETIKEGPSHEPYFRSTVIIDNVRYDSLPGFFNRKAAEQSAAEVALIELANTVDMKFRIAQPVHETGLSKNLLQEYAQKMNYAMPWYECQKDEKQGKMFMYSCVVEVGSVKYIGASASTKKEAEIKAAGTALLAIQSASSVSEARTSVYTVVPHKKKISDPGISTRETAAALKRKKGRFSQQRRKKRPFKKGRSTQRVIDVMQVDMDSRGGGESEVPDSVSSQHNMTGSLEVNVDGSSGAEMVATDAVNSQVKVAGGFNDNMDVSRNEILVSTAPAAKEQVLDSHSSEQ